MKFLLGLLALVGIEASAEPIQYISGASSDTLVHSSNLNEYADLIVPELYNAVKQGSLVMNYSTKLPYELKYSWEENGSDSIKLKKDGSLERQGKIEDGLLFSPQSLNKKQDNAASKVLWNIQSENWSKPLQHYNFSIRVLEDEKITRELKGDVTRLYNWRLSENDATGQLFREVISFQQPEIIKKYTWLTFRFFDKTEDVLWVYSPAIGKVRELTGSNRSDSIASTISADDFMLWSGKVELVNPQKMKRRTSLIPIGAAAALQPQKDGCLMVADTQSSKQDLQMRWNYGSRKYAQGASWLPTDAVYIKRPLWRLDLQSQDPYSLYGHQVLYVDAETMLPIYKFVYDRAGVFWKSVIMIYGFAANKDGERLAYPSEELVVDMKSNHVIMMDYLDVSYCKELPKDFDLSIFDYRKFNPPAKK